MLISFKLKISFELMNRWFIMYKASSILFALKKIQANETKINVIATSENLFKNVFCFLRKLDILNAELFLFQNLIELF